MNFSSLLLFFLLKNVISQMCTANAPSKYCEFCMSCEEPLICEQCELGFWCDGEMQTECSPGTYSDEFASCECKMCSAGCYCPSQQSESDCAMSCVPGEYCPPGTWDESNLACPAGWYCSTPDRKEPCPMGRWSAQTGLESALQCTGNCSFGYWCGNASTSATENLCDPGCMCEELSGVSCPEQCPVGYYCPAGSHSLTKVQCTIIGKYCGIGSSAENDCPGGYYCPNPTTKIICPIGHYCPPGTVYNTIQNCTGEGMYCGEGQESEMECGIGFYCPDVFTRYSCTPGMYCEIGNLTAPSGLCYEQYYCPGGSISPYGSGYCDDGYYCPIGSSSSTQNICQEYNYCQNGTIFPCAITSYCPEGSSDEVACECNGNGRCYTSKYNCECFENWGGNSCNKKQCFGINFDNSSTCNNHGMCVDINKCNCGAPYVGSDCSLFPCGKFIKNDTKSCNGHGKCTDVNVCSCVKSWHGNECQYVSSNGVVETIVALSITTLFVVLCCIVVVIIVGVIVVYFVYFRGKLKLLNKYKDDITLLEVEEKENENGKLQPTFKLNTKFFQIDQKDIKLERKLGSGGFGEVYLASWEGKSVALKLFATKNFSGQQNFEEFEKELDVLSNISHPSITHFYGCCMKHPRVGIITEFCELGDLRNYLLLQKHKHNKIVPISQRLKWLVDISDAMNYLHKRNIIHRDLKTENILISKTLDAKLCDFGLSRVIESSDTSSNLTKRTGTSLYMAPEVALGLKYSEKCDVFSFAIIMYEVFLDKSDIYDLGENSSSGIELRVANGLRPVIKDDMFNESDMWMKNLIVKSWDEIEQSRPSFMIIKEEIQKNIKEKN